MATPLRWDLLPAVLDHLPSELADAIGLKDPLDYFTHVDAYLAIYSSGVEIDERLIGDFKRGVIAYLGEHNR